MAGVRREVTVTGLLDLTMYSRDEIRGGRSGPLFLSVFPGGCFYGRPTQTLLTVNPFQ